MAGNNPTGKNQYTKGGLKRNNLTALATRLAARMDTKRIGAIDGQGYKNNHEMITSVINSRKREEKRGEHKAGRPERGAAYVRNSLARLVSAHRKDGQHAQYLSQAMKAKPSLGKRVEALKTTNPKGSVRNEHPFVPADGRFKHINPAVSKHINMKQVKVVGLLKKK